MPDEEEDNELINMYEQLEAENDAKNRELQVRFSWKLELLIVDIFKNNNCLTTHLIINIGCVKSLSRFVNELLD